MSKFSWTTDIKEAEQQQTTLRGMLHLQPFEIKQSTRILAIGVSYDDANKLAYATGLEMQSDGKPVSRKIHKAETHVDFPYIPGLFAFREGPAVCELLEQLPQLPNLLLLDAQGIAHPRGFGLASHIGVLFDTASIGLTRNNLWGKYAEPARIAHASSVIKINQDVVGLAYRLTEDSNPIFVSPGHKTDVETARRWLTGVNAVRHSLPEALQRAHVQANRYARQPVRT